MIDKDARLAILADALTKIVEVAATGSSAQVPAADLLERTGDLAAQALGAAATYGPLPPPVAPDTALPVAAGGKNVR